MYIDYVSKVSSQFVVRRGESVGEVAREFLACRNIRQISDPLPTHCNPDSIANPKGFPNDGKTTADIYTPFSFAATRILAQPFILVGVDFISAARLTGMVWLAIAAVALFFALRRLRIPVVFSASFASLLVGSSAAFWSNTYVSTDATAMTAGAVAFYLAVRAWTDPRWMWLFGAAAVVSTVVKLQNLLPFAALALFFLLERIREYRVRPDGGWVKSVLMHRTVLIGIGSLVMSAAGEVAWLSVRSALAVGDAGSLFVPAPFSLAAFTEELFRFLPGMAEGALDPAQTGPGAIVPVGVLSLLVVGGVVGLWASSPGLSSSSNLAASVLAVAIFSAPMLAAVSAVMTGQYIALVPRYGLSLLPLTIACAAALFAPRRAMQVPTAIVALGCFALVLTIPH
ncbi:hypothetical protein [Plantibacter sp. CFBP 13570]|uniref:hypothetical protein n=1 Tax=Plantibacter sp. CFBP 13570 TaxID=2775272 RepID=UPI0019309CE3|nr:hypothetical protein [Plantibacter sp. CFBP 13570]MBD8533862.1 hypothetical protein [Plantibacter sp. CFBP 13570]